MPGHSLLLSHQNPDSVQGTSLEPTKYKPNILFTMKPGLKCSRSSLTQALGISPSSSLIISQPACPAATNATFYTPKLLVPLLPPSPELAGVTGPTVPMQALTESAGT